MTISRVSGNLLQDNLQRGANLSIQGNLLHIDVDNDRIGVYTTTTDQTLTVNGNIGVGNIVLESDSIESANDLILAPVGNILASNVNIKNLADPVANSDAATKFYVDSVSSNVTIDITDGVNTESVVNGATITFSGTVGQITASVTSTDTITHALTSDVVIGNSISLPHANISVEVIAAQMTVIGNISAGNLITNGLVEAVGNITGGNVITPGAISASGNITGGNFISIGDMTAVSIVTSGNITAGGNVDGGNIVTSGTIISIGNVVANNLVASNAIDTQSAIIGNILISNSEISSVNDLNIVSAIDGNIQLAPQGNGVVQIDSHTGLTVPTGNIAQRPIVPDTGSLRFNSETGFLEYYDGASWDSIGVNFTVDSQTITPDGISNTFTLDRSTSTTEILVQINGVGQIPDTAYTVAGNQIAFTEIPEVSDVLEIRYLTAVAASGSVSPGVAPRLACYSVSGSTVQDTGANLTWNGTDQLTVIGNTIISGAFLQVPVYANATVRDTSIASPAAGMIVLTGSIFTGYNGTVWSTLSS